MANSARERSTCAAGALSERLRRVSSWRSSAVSGRRGSFWWRDMGHLGDEDHRTTIPLPMAIDPLVVINCNPARRLPRCPAEASEGRDLRADCGPVLGIDRLDA